MQLTHRIDRMLVSCLAIVALALPSAAGAEPLCEQVCTPTSSCGKLCWEDGTKMTCGQYGTCNAPPPPPPCTPNWQQVSSTASGYVHYNDYQGSTTTCRVFRMNEILEHDLNQCNPQHLTRQRCVPQVVQEYYSCCTQGCYPQIHDESWCEAF